MGFSTDSLRNTLSNPQREYLWEILIPSPIGGGNGDTFALRARSTEIPSTSFAAINIPYKQTAGFVVAGKRAVTHSWSVTVMDGEDHAMYDFLYDWQQQIVNNVTGIGVGDPLYKTDGYVILQNTVGTNGMKLKLKGIYVQEIGSSALNYESNEILKYNVTFAFDDVEKM